MLRIWCYNSMEDIDLFIKNYEYEYGKKPDKIQLYNRNIFIKIFKEKYGYFHSNPPMDFEGFQNFTLREMPIEFI